MSDSAYHKVCKGCRWIYFVSPNEDTGFCGPCARERGLLPRTAETDLIDERYRVARAIKEHRDAE